MNMLCVLARVPAPGTGKSRLRGALGDAATDHLAGAFLRDVLAWVSPGALQVLVAYDGPPALLPAGPSGCLLVAQAPGDLGARIAAGVDACFEQGASRVVVVGTDCPTLPAALLDAAFTGLSRAASTIIPASDGGWIALGVDRPIGLSLAGVAWSSAVTCAETIASLRTDGRAPLVLPSWYDIDEPSDLARVGADPDSRHRAPRTVAALHGMPAGIR